MELANLAAFIAVADCGGFSAAADHIHLTQPAISKRIAQLEDGLQARLFDRIGRHSDPRIQRRRRGASVDPGNDCGGGSG